MKKSLRWRTICTCVLAAGVLSAASCGDHRSPTAATSVTTAPAATTAQGSPANGESPQSAPLPAPAAATVYLAGAGDIADPSFPDSVENATRTAQLIAGLPTFPIVFTAGDNEQSDGSYPKFLNGFGKTWGLLRNRILPTPGNHDFTPGYFQYFGASADPEGHGNLGYYAVRLSSAWQFISLNSQIGARSGSPQYAWLAQRLAEGSPCTFVVYHEPLQTNSENPPATGMRDVWNLLYRHGAEVVVNGHNHVYERFPRKDDSLRRDPVHGVRQFTVGTGGYKSYGFRRSEFDYDVRFTDVFGIITFTLEADRYSWEFITTKGPLDSGSEACHAAPKR